MENYSERVWLNSVSSNSTGSIVCFSGVSNFKYHGDTTPAYTRFVEIADCHNKVSLHQSRCDSLSDYKQKIRKLYNEIGKYLERLDVENESKEMRMK